MKRNWLSRSLALLICIAPVGFLGCQNETYKVGVVLPTTGEAAVYGQAVKNGIEVAYEQIQADPDFNVPLELEFFDSGSDPEKGKALLKQSFDNGAFAALGGITASEAKVMVEEADRVDRILLSPTASLPALTGISKNFYRVFPSDFTAGTKMANFANDAGKIDSVVILAESQEYAKGIQQIFETEFERLGGEVLEVIEFPPNTSDFAALIERTMDLEPDAVYLAAYADGIGQLIRELRKVSYSGKILTTDAFSLPSTIAEVGSDAKDVLLTMILFELDSEHAHIKSFVTAYREKFGNEPDLYAAHGYDAMRIMASVFKDQQPALPSEVHKGMRGIKDFPGVTGSIQFDERGDVQKFPRVYVIGEDLGLYDYNARVQQQKEELRRRMEELKRKTEAMNQG